MNPRRLAPRRRGKGRDAKDALWLDMRARTLVDAIQHAQFLVLIRGALKQPTRTSLALDESEVKDMITRGLALLEIGASKKLKRPIANASGAGGDSDAADEAGLRAENAKLGQMLSECQAEAARKEQSPQWDTSFSSDQKQVRRLSSSHGTKLWPTAMRGDHGSTLVYVDRTAARARARGLGDQVFGCARRHAQRAHTYRAPADSNRRPEAIIR